jgi:hypothetical protein
MSLMNKQVRRIAIIGTGVIGASWAAQEESEMLLGLLRLRAGPGRV